MPQIRVLPVLPLDDAVVLPGMVVSLDMSDEQTRAAVDAARAGGSAGSPDARAPGIASRAAGRPRCCSFPASTASSPRSPRSG